MSFLQTLQYQQDCQKDSCRRSQCRKRDILGVMTVIDSGKSVCLEDIVRLWFPQEGVVTTVGRQTCVHQYQVQLKLNSWAPIVTDITLDLGQSIRIGQYLDNTRCLCVCRHFYCILSGGVNWFRLWKIFLCA